MISAVRFFTIAPLHSRYMLLAMAAVLLSGIMMLIVNPAKGADVLGPLALLQMLSASTGFAVAARRGYYDLLLTAGPGRASVALTHLGLSVLPGVLVWGVLGMVEMMVARTTSPLAFTSGSTLSLCAISLLAWAMTVSVPRLSGGIAWLLAIAVWVIGWSGGPTLVAARQGGADQLTLALVATLCPFVLLGKRLSADEVLVVLPIVTLASGFTAAAVAGIVRMDVPLESAQ